MVFFTSVPASTAVAVYDGNGAMIAAAVDNSLKQSRLITTPDTLPQGTLLTYEVMAKDSAGHTWIDTCSFTTLRRKVTVTFNKITVNDDSDDLSSGEFWVHLGALGQQHGFVFGGGLLGLSSGQSVNLANTFSADKVARSVLLRSQMIDNDEDFWDFCTNGIGADFMPWTNACEDSGAANKWVYLPSQGVGTGTVDVSQTSDNWVGFTAFAKVSWTIY